jgi:hypothetical protein
MPLTDANDSKDWFRQYREGESLPPPPTDHSTPDDAPVPQDWDWPHETYMGSAISTPSLHS